MPMRIFLAGATGAIGRPLLPMLLARGHQVTALARRPEQIPGLRALGAEVVVADALDHDAIVAAVHDARPDVVMHQLTGLSGADPGQNAALRRAATRNLADAGVRRMVAQSIAFAYEPGDTPAGETTPLDVHASEPRATTVSGVVALEDAVREAAEWVLLRFGTFYGPGTWYARDGRMGELARAGKLPVGPDVTSFLHVLDAAAAAVAALEWPTGEVNVCDDEPAPGSAWTPLFCSAVGAPAPPLAVGGRAGWARGASNAKAKSLGWAPAHPSWRTGFAEL